MVSAEFLLSLGNKMFLLENDCKGELSLNI